MTESMTVSVNDANQIIGYSIAEATTDLRHWGCNKILQQQFKVTTFDANGKAMFVANEWRDLPWVEPSAIGPSVKR